MPARRAWRALSSRGPLRVRRATPSEVLGVTDVDEAVQQLVDIDRRGVSLGAVRDARLLIEDVVHAQQDAAVPRGLVADAQVMDGDRAQLVGAGAEAGGFGGRHVALDACVDVPALVLDRAEVTEAPGGAPVAHRPVDRGVR